MTHEEQEQRWTLLWGAVLDGIAAAPYLGDVRLIAKSLNDKFESGVLATDTDLGLLAAVLHFARDYEAELRQFFGTPEMSVEDLTVMAGARLEVLKSPPGRAAA